MVVVVSEVVSPIRGARPPGRSLVARRSSSSSLLGPRRHLPQLLLPPRYAVHRGQPPLRFARRPSQDCIQTLTAVIAGRSARLAVPAHNVASTSRVFQLQGTQQRKYVSLHMQTWHHILIVLVKCLYAHA